MVLHEGSRNPHTSVMENTKESHTNVEHKNPQIDEVSWKTI